MRYKIEELVPIAGRLAERLTAFESTSIPYGKAEQLMGAVCYCIREAGQMQSDSPIPMEGLSAAQAYGIGAAAVQEKARAAAALYNQISETFQPYGNRCLSDTFVEGMPEFFKHYDAVFAPQETILTLDYPVLRDLSGKTGIDKISAFLECIRLEQGFLAGFPAGAVEGLLSRYCPAYGELVENICGMVLEALWKEGLRALPEGLAQEYRDYLAPALRDIALRQRDAFA